ncbi:MAG: hypothetical protein IKT08_05735 [Bacteroidales bacterium]|nr:hypothetical protein [Bacteroidales bacterium]
MKKLLVLMLCMAAIAFTSCKPDPEPEPEPDVTPTEAFTGHYDGILYLNATATAPQLGEDYAYTFDSTAFHLTADLTPGDNDETVNVLFTMLSDSEDQTYETTGTVSGNTINFGDLTYHYVENISTFDVTLTLSGELNNNALALNGPAIGTGYVSYMGMMLDITVVGTVDGTLNKTTSK